MKQFVSCLLVLIASVWPSVRLEAQAPFGCGQGLNQAPAETHRTLNWQGMDKLKMSASRPKSARPGSARRTKSRDSEVQPLYQDSFNDGSLVLSEGQYTLGEDIYLDDSTHLFLDGTAELNCLGRHITGDGTGDDNLPLEDASFAVSLQGNARLTGCDISLFQTNVFARGNARIIGGRFDRALNVGMYISGAVRVYGNINAGEIQSARPFSWGAFVAGVYLDQASGSNFYGQLQVKNNWHYGLLLQSSHLNGFNGITGDNDQVCGSSAVRLDDSNGNHFRNLLRGGGSQSSLELNNSSGNVFGDIQSINNHSAITLIGSDNNSFQELNIESAEDTALDIYLSDGNIFESISAYDNIFRGIWLNSSNYNSFGQLYVRNTGGAGYGMSLSTSNDNQIMHLTTENATIGLYLHDSSRNLFDKIDALRNSGYGAWLYWATDNTLGTVKILGRSEMDTCLRVERLADLTVLDPLVMLHNCHIGLYLHRAPLTFNPYFYGNDIDMVQPR